MPQLFNQFTLNRIFFSFFLFSFLSSAVFTLIFIDTTNELLDSTLGLYGYASGGSGAGSGSGRRNAVDHEVVGNVVYSKLPTYRRYSSTVDTPVHGDSPQNSTNATSSNATEHETAAHAQAETLADPPSGLGLARILLHTAERELESDAKALNISWQVDRSSSSKQRHRQQYARDADSLHESGAEEKEPLLSNKLSNKEFTDAYLLALPASTHYIPTPLNTELIEAIVNNEVQPQAPSTLLLSTIDKYIKTDSTSSYVPQYASRLTRYMRTDGHNFFHTATQYANTEARINDYLNALHVEDDSYYTTADDDMFYMLFTPENWMLSEYMGESSNDAAVNTLYNSPYEVRNTDWVEVHSELIPGITTHTAVTTDHSWIAIVYNRYSEIDEHTPPTKRMLRVYHVNTTKLLDEHDPDDHVNEDLFSVDIKLSDNARVTALDITSVHDDTLSASVTLGYENDRRPFHSIVVTATPSEEDPSHYSLRQTEKVSAPTSDNRAPLSETLLIQSYDVPPTRTANNATTNTSAATREPITQRALIVESSRTPTSTCAQYSVSLWHRDAAGWYQSEEMKQLTRKLNFRSRHQQKLANPHVQYLPSTDDQGATSQPATQRYQHQQSYNLRNELVHSTSSNQIFNAICHLPYVAAIDPSSQPQPIEITNLHASTVFNNIAINNYGDLIAIHEHHANIILLQRQLQAGSTTTTDSSASSSLHWLGNSKWEVISEIQFPEELRMYDLLQMQFVDVNHVYHTQKAAAQTSANDTSKDNSAVPAATSPIIQSNTYLTVLLQHGILMSYDIVTKSTTILPTASGETQHHHSAPTRHRAEELGPLAELLGAESDDWYTLITTLCTRFEFVCGVLTVLFFTLPILQQFVTQLFLRHFMPRIERIDDAPTVIDRTVPVAEQAAPTAPVDDTAPFVVPPSMPLI